MKSETTRKGPCQPTRPLLGFWLPFWKKQEGTAGSEMKDIIGHIYKDSPRLLCWESSQMVFSTHRETSQQAPIESKGKQGLDQKAMVKAIPTGCLWDACSVSNRIIYWWTGCWHSKTGIRFVCWILVLFSLLNTALASVLGITQEFLCLGLGPRLGNNGNSGAK